METEREHFPKPREGFVVTHFITSRDVGRSAAFYRDVLGGEVVHEGSRRRSSSPTAGSSSTSEADPPTTSLTSCWSRREIRTRRAPS